MTSTDPDIDKLMAEKAELAHIALRLRELADRVDILMASYPPSEAHANYFNHKPSERAALSIEAAKHYLGVVHVNLENARIAHDEADLGEVVRVGWRSSEE